MFGDIQVSVGDAEPDALSVQAAVAHKVTDELGQFWCHDVRNTYVPVPGVVRLVEDGQRDRARFADQGAHLHRHDVTWGDVGQPLPLPFRRGRVHDLDAVGEGALDGVAAAGRDAAGRLLAVNEELRRLAGGPG